MTALLLPTDGCPACVTPCPVHPHDIQPVNDRGDVAAHYTCPACHFSWWTSWHADALNLPCPGCPACTNTEGQVA